MLQSWRKFENGSEACDSCDGASSHWSCTPIFREGLLVSQAHTVGCADPKYSGFCKLDVLPCNTKLYGVAAWSHTVLCVPFSTELYDWLVSYRWHHKQSTVCASACKYNLHSIALCMTGSVSLCMSLCVCMCMTDLCHTGDRVGTSQDNTELSITTHTTSFANMPLTIMNSWKS